MLVTDQRQLMLTYDGNACVYASNNYIFYDMQMASNSKSNTSYVHILVVPLYAHQTT